MLPLHVNSLRPARIAPSAANKLFLFSSAGVSPLFVALPYVSVVSPLSTAFTHSDRGGRVRTFRPSDVQTAHVPIYRPSDFPTFRRSDFPTFRPSDVQTFRHADFPFRPADLFLFTDLRVALPATPVFSQPSAL